MGHRRTQSALGAVARDRIADPPARGVPDPHQPLLGIRLRRGCCLQHQSRRGPAARGRPHPQEVASLLEWGNARRPHPTTTLLRYIARSQSWRSHLVARTPTYDVDMQIMCLRNSDERGQASPTLDGQALAPLGAPAREHAPPTHGLHSLPEAVAPLAHDVARLIGPFHAPSPPPGSVSHDHRGRRCISGPRSAVNEPRCSAAELGRSAAGEPVLDEAT